jgi:hypothetical protein
MGFARSIGSSTPSRPRHGCRPRGGAMGIAAMTLAIIPAGAIVSPGSLFVGPHTTVSEIGSTVPSNGDVNPYGVAVVSRSQGTEVAGDVLVSNFNSGPGPAGLQGLGTTIVQLDPGAAPHATPQVFAQIDPAHLPGACPGGVGLTTALAILPGGWVVVGSLPTSDGTTISGAGCLLVLDNTGHVVETFSGGPINGPWDMTSVSAGAFPSCSSPTCSTARWPPRGARSTRAPSSGPSSSRRDSDRRTSWRRRSSRPDSPKSSTRLRWSSARPESPSAATTLPSSWRTPSTIALWRFRSPPSACTRRGWALPSRPVGI